MGKKEKVGDPKKVYSKPTKCFRCSLIVEMTHLVDADPQEGAWTCPQCNKLYPFRLWKIRKKGGQRKKRSKSPSPTTEFVPSFFIKHESARD